MKTRYCFILISLSLIFSFASLVQAKPHLCPSIDGIRAAFKNQEVMSFDQDWMGNKYPQLDFLSTFDTSETWFLHFRRGMSVTNKTEAWNSFQEVLRNIPNETRYALDNLFTWDCVYIKEYNGGYALLMVRLMSP